MTKTPFTLNCRAEQFTELLGISSEDIQELIVADPVLGVKFFQQILTKVVGKMRNNNMYSVSIGGGAVLDSYIEHGPEQEPVD